MTFRPTWLFWHSSGRFKCLEGDNIVYVGDRWSHAEGFIAIFYRKGKMLREQGGFKSLEEGQAWVDEQYYPHRFEREVLPDRCS